MYMCAGVARFASDRHTFRSIHFPYPQYATTYNARVATTHRKGVFRKSTTQPPPASPDPVLGVAVGNSVRLLRVTFRAHRHSSKSSRKGLGGRGSFQGRCPIDPLDPLESSSLVCSP